MPEICLYVYRDECKIEKIDDELSSVTVVGMDVPLWVRNENIYSTMKLMRTRRGIDKEISDVPFYTQDGRQFILIVLPHHFEAFRRDYSWAAVGLDGSNASNVEAEETCDSSRTGSTPAPISETNG